ncbi:UDP-glucuronosyl/UDP-glucosyltransferase [Corchorus capsularis]|uniref:UDP-glucuronosyl/UDP-glucosyltransferase n=1 Tax=Corchorus capsularis TaxID=210143 RepID=A0A1R3IGY8_COCAP|nr:UDP-glucuronosyl/UDP-glucosyltransferase [Corchorus capsularis]
MYRKTINIVTSSNRRFLNALRLEFNAGSSGAGVPMITWPMFGEQIGNEWLLVESLKVGVRIGIDAAMKDVKELDLAPFPSNSLSAFHCNSVVMASLSNDKLHFVLFPFMAPGHLIPMVDIGRLLAQRGMIVTIVTTPLNASRVHKSVSRAMESGQDIRLVPVQFPCKQVGLPEGCENLDMLPSVAEYLQFFTAANLMEEAVMKLFEKLSPLPNCIISDMCLHYTSKLASKFQVPRISFHGYCCFSLLCMHNIHSSKILETITSDFEYFTMPGLPIKLEFTRVQLVVQSDNSKGPMKEIFEKIEEVDRSSFGVVINTFEELESPFVEEYRRVRNGKAWCIGPVSLSHKDELDKSQRGNNASINDHECLKWLDCQEPNSVIYVCLGSMSRLRLSHLKELGLGLEASNKPFIWVLRGNDISKKVVNWMKEEGFEERIKGRGLVILGWVPQVLILSHPAIGGFLTHCGWNSTVEGISAGLPFITWPQVSDQFTDEKLIVQILKVGVSLGVEKQTILGVEENTEAIVKKDDVKNAIERLMDEGNEGMERRKRAKEFGDKANKAVAVGGSSYLNLTMFIQDIRQQSQKMCL